jgi:hypothetical protein
MAGSFSRACERFREGYPRLVALPKSVLIVVALAAIVAAGCASEPTSGSGRTDLILAPDGIGIYLIGQPADEVIEGISATIGGPDGDSSESNSPLFVPDCSGPGVRIVSWGSLTLFFVERLGTSVFDTWWYGFDPLTGNAGDDRSLGLVTEEGIGLGSTRDELVGAYGLGVRFDDDPALELSVFTIDANASEHLGGRLTSTSADARVQFIERRPDCENS